MTVILMILAVFLVTALCWWGSHLLWWFETEILPYLHKDG